MFSLPYMRVLTPLFALAAVVALFAYTHLTLRQAEYAMTGPTVISVTGEGEAVAVPDVATFSFGVLAEGADAVEAQDMSAESMNAILEYLEDEGIAEEDIKTSYYNLNPKYEWVSENTAIAPGGRQVLVGYQVNQTVTVKVRNTDQAGALISGVGDHGATNVSSLQFTTEDDEVLKSEARANAIANAQEKAEQLAEDLGVRIVRMTGFWEDQNSIYGYGGSERSYMAADAMMVEKAVANIPVGENTTTVRVNISYEVR